MIKITTSKGTFLFIEVPNDAYDFEKEEGMIWYKTLPDPSLNDNERIHNVLHPEEDFDDYEILSTSRLISDWQIESMAGEEEDSEAAMSLEAAFKEVENAFEKNYLILALYAR